jgi:hypothetical protein
MACLTPNNDIIGTDPLDYRNISKKNLIVKITFESMWSAYVSFHSRMHNILSTPILFCQFRTRDRK